MENENAVPVEEAVEPEAPTSTHADYDFRNVRTEKVKHKDGVTYPILSGRVVAWRDNGWKGVGSFRVRLQKVKRDETDVEDIELNFSGRINPKAG